MTAAAYCLVQTPSHTDARRLQGENCAHCIGEENEAHRHHSLMLTLHGGFTRQGDRQKGLPTAQSYLPLTLQTMSGVLMNYLGLPGI